MLIKSFFINLVLVIASSKERIMILYNPTNSKDICNNNDPCVWKSLIDGFPWEVTTRQGQNLTIVQGFFRKLIPYEDFITKEYAAQKRGNYNICLNCYKFFHENVKYFTKYQIYGYADIDWKRKYKIFLYRHNETNMACVLFYKDYIYLKVEDYDKQTVFLRLIKVINSLYEISKDRYSIISFQANFFNYSFININQLIYRDDNGFISYPNLFESNDYKEYNYKYKIPKQELNLVNKESNFYENLLIDCNFDN